MAATYGLMQSVDEAAVLDLWVASFGRTAVDHRRDWQIHDSRVFVARSAEGVLLATAGYYARAVRDVDGAPQLVGLVINVVTRPEVRQQGHATQLMERLLAAMHADGCRWSLLFTSEIGRLLYARCGYRTFPLPMWLGSLAPPPSIQSGSYTIQHYDPWRASDHWDTLARLYESYNARRPASLVRDRSYWHNYLAYQLATPESDALILVARSATDCQTICGYVLAYCSAEEVQISEVGALPNDLAAIPALCEAVARNSATHGVRQGRVCLPDSPEIHRALVGMFGELLQHGKQQHLMAYPLGADWSMARLDALFRVPGAYYWGLD